MTLKDILDATKEESVERQRKYSLDFVVRKVEKMSPTRGFARALRRLPFSVIAELKRKSPSMGQIKDADFAAVTAHYHAHPVVSAISVLTQRSHFGGEIDFLAKVRNMTQVKPKPILRKDFIFSEYEVYYSRWAGADAILLMANVVEDKVKFKELHDLAVSIGLDVLCEVHDEQEIDILPDTVKICGINSRRFKDVSQSVPVAVKLQLTSANHDTKTDIGTFALFDQLVQKLGSDCLKVAESGLSSSNIEGVLRQYPFNAALIGTSLLKSGKDGLVKELNTIKKSAEDALNATVAAAGRGEPIYAGK